MEGIEISLKLYCDNKSVVMYSNSNRSSTKSKYINIKFLIVMETFRAVFMEHIGVSCSRLRFI